MAFDVNSANEMVEAMRRAREITGLVCSADEEQRASEEFMGWAQGNGLRARFYRAMGAGGEAVWVLRVETDRGKLEEYTRDPRKWREVVERLGLGGLL